MPETFSGLEDAVRPFRFGEGARSIDRRHVMFADDADPDELEDPDLEDPDDFEDADDFEELDDRENETVFLAPRRDFSPSAMARDEGADADIESPFAQSESKTVTELMSPVRHADGDFEQSQHVFEAKAPVTNKGPVARMPPLEPEPSLPPVSPAPPASPMPPVSPMPPASPPISPSLIRPRLVRPEPVPPKSGPALVGPPSFGDDDVVPRRRPVNAPQPESPPALAGPPSFGDDDVAPRRRPVNTPQPESPPALVGPPSFGDDDVVPRRRPVNAPQPESPPALAGPPTPVRLRRALGAMSRAGSFCLGVGATASGASAKGCRALVRGCGSAWALYSRRCLALQARLSLLVGSALVQARALASHAGSASLRLGRANIEGCRTGGAYARGPMRGAARLGLVLAKAALSLANKSVAHAGVLILQMRALAVSAFGKLRLVAESWLAAWAKRRAAAAEAAKAVKAAEVAKAVQTLNARAGTVSTTPKASSPPSPAEKAPEPQVAAKPAMAFQAPPPSVKTPSPVKKPSTTEKVSVNASSSVDRSLAQSTSRLTWRHGPQRLALAGLAAASLVFLITAFAFSPAAGPASAALTFPIPEKPVIGVIPPKEAAPIPSELDDPIALMLAHVGEQAPAVSDTNPVLARARSVEGVSQFVRAAEIVGLGELLEPGEAYTIFVPNDQAFAELAAGEVDSLFEPAGHERLLTLLSHHVLRGRLTVDDVQGDVAQYTSLAEALVSIDATEVMSVSGAGMVETDLAAGNGVLHVIDRVLPITTP